MKKGFSILLCLYLLMNTIGYNVYAHFCGDDLKETSVIVDTGSCCSDDEEKANAGEDMSCCTDEVKQVIIKDDYLKVPSLKINDPLVFELFVIPFNLITVAEALPVSAFIIHNDTPPEGRKTPIHIINQVFRI